METTENLLGIYPLEYLKFKFKQKYLPENKFYIINGCSVNENDDINNLNGEIFRKHPYLPVYASNYGRIKNNEKIMEQKSLKDGYLYVDIPYDVENLKRETWEEYLKMENGMETPIVEEAMDYNELDTNKCEHEKFEWHPKIQIGVSNYGKIKNWYNGKHYGKYFKVFHNKFIIISIYVYRIVAETWIENPNYKIYNIVHHISNNGYDNTIFNLMWVNKKQHNEIEK
jgi:hypothetical protein